MPSVLQGLIKQPYYQFSSIQQKESIRDTQLGISTYMKNIYGTSLLSFGSMLVGASLLTPVLPPTPALFGGFVLSLGGIIGFQMSQKNYISKIDVNNQQKLVAQYTPFQKMLYLSFLFGGALTMTPVLQYASMIGPWTIPLSLLLTLGTFGGASLYAMSKPVGEFNKWGGTLTGILVSCLLMNLAGIGSLYFMGPNLFS